MLPGSDVAAFANTRDLLVSAATEEIAREQEEPERSSTFALAPCPLRVDLRSGYPSRR
jgi:hypothetical protein